MDFLAKPTTLYIEVSCLEPVSGGLNSGLVFIVSSLKSGTLLYMCQKVVDNWNKCYNMLPTESDSEFSSFRKKTSEILTCSLHKVVLNSFWKFYDFVTLSVGPGSVAHLCIL